MPESENSEKLLPSLKEAVVKSLPQLLEFPEPNVDNYRIKLLIVVKRNAKALVSWYEQHAKERLSEEDLACINNNHHYEKLKKMMNESSATLKPTSIDLLKTLLLEFVENLKFNRGQRKFVPLAKQIEIYQKLLENKKD